MSSDPVKLKPYPYQSAAVDAVARAIYDGFRRPMIVAPTGSGKSVMLASLIERYFSKKSDAKILVLAHVKELLEQNARAILNLTEGIRVGVYSAGLRLKQHAAPVVVAGIQSIWKKAEIFVPVDLVIVDECHLVNAKSAGMYRSFLDDLQRANPNLVIVGLTATHYRLGTGYLHTGEGAFFDCVAYEIPVETLIQDGKLCRPVPRVGCVEADLDGVRIRGGEYVESDLQEAFDAVGITDAAVSDIIDRASDRRSILVFATGVRHAEHVVDALRSAGLDSVEMVTGKTPPAARRALVARVKRGALRVLVNVGVFTTGFDAPCIDCIVLLRATKSTSLYVQMIGRGMRIAPGKSDCLVLDYGGNVRRHGPVNDLKIYDPEEGNKKKPGGGGWNAAECPECSNLISPNTRVCPHCGWERPPNHDFEAAALAIVSTKRVDVGQRVWFPVVDHFFCSHQKLGGGRSLKMEYEIENGEWVTEWICFEHPMGSWPRKKAIGWAIKSGIPRPQAEAMTVADAIEIEWSCPAKILVTRNNNTFLNVVDHDFGEASA